MIMIISQIKDIGAMGFSSASTFIFLLDCTSPSDVPGLLLIFVFTVGISLIINQFSAHETKVGACNDN